MSIVGRHSYAYLALGEKCKECSFYANLHQAQIDKVSIDTTVEPTMLTSDALIENTNCDFNDYDKENMHPGINESVNESSINESSDNNDDSEDDENLNQLTANEFCWFYNDIENLIKEDDPAFNKSVCKFIKAYKKHRLIQDTHTRPAIASFFQTCDWKSDRVNGRPRTGSQEITDDIKELNRFVMPARSRRQQTKRSHNLSKALEENHPNSVI
ncbi:hypothetical protein C2G38_2198158 [Gigaspora rosea]|uniref:Uncharacterized protein n=1 Tax=Gigaspora rosea TaxID=44941 RepID=A0A397UUN9_9GLOM|nr:hypothetical protein C2G38_2198158 [Gigaspora rosea]